jgi:hypothetical protein
MASLTEVYEGGAGGPDLRRLYLGVGSFLVGIALTVGGIVVATSTGAAAALGLGTYAARELGGILAGVGLPLTFLGVVVVLPQTNRRVNAAAAVGSAVALLAVVLFAEVYPQAWFSNAFVVVGVYFLGAVTTLWALFTAVANFKTRNDPGGTVELEITEGGETRVVEVSNRNLRQKLGGVGFMGGQPDGNVETQTAGTDSGGTGGSGRTGASTTSATGANTTTTTSADRSTTGGSAGSSAGSSGGKPESLTERARSTAGSGGRSRGSGSGSRSGGGSRGGSFGTGAATSDGGTTTEDGTEFLSDGNSDPHPNQDRYCGNCSHFRYVRTDQGMQPYCGLHGDVMDDMDACSEWTPNNQ